MNKATECFLNKGLSNMTFTCDTHSPLSRQKDLSQERVLLLLYNSGHDLSAKLLRDERKIIIWSVPDVLGSVDLLCKTDTHQYTIVCLWVQVPTTVLAYYAWASITILPLDICFVNWMKIQAVSNPCTSDSLLVTYWKCKEKYALWYFCACCLYLCKHIVFFWSLCRKFRRKCLFSICRWT